LSGIINPNKPEPLSFSFRGVNCRQYGLIVNSYDFLLPEKRVRKIQVPFQDGSYNYAEEDGQDYWNDRELRLRCVWISGMLKQISRKDIRETSYWLSHRGRIVLDIEPDKYYYGELFDPNQLTAHYDYIIDPYNSDSGGGTTDGEFEITFICRPFAFGKIVNQQISDGINIIKYEGTAKTPALIVLRNEGNQSVSNVQIVVTRRI